MCPRAGCSRACSAGHLYSYCPQQVSRCAAAAALARAACRLPCPDAGVPHAVLGSALSFSAPLPCYEAAHNISKPLLGCAVLSPKSWMPRPSLLSSLLTSAVQFVKMRAGATPVHARTGQWRGLSHRSLPLPIEGEAPVQHQGITVTLLPKLAFFALCVKTNRRARATLLFSSRLEP